MSSKCGLPRRWRMFSFEPVKKLSTQRTSCPSATRRSQRCEPMNPAPPVTRTVFPIRHPSVRVFDCATIHAAAAPAPAPELAGSEPRDRVGDVEGEDARILLAELQNADRGGADLDSPKQVERDSRE